MIITVVEKSVWPYLLHILANTEAALIISVETCRDQVTIY